VQSTETGNTKSPDFKALGTFTVSRSVAMKALLASAVLAAPAYIIGFP